MAKKPSYPHREILEQYEKIVCSVQGVDRKGATMPYTSLNGNMFSFLNKDGKMGLRLNPADREAFLKDHQTQLIVSHGTTMKEYVEVPSNLFSSTRKMQEYFRKSHAYVSSLKPKPTKKKK